MNKDKIIIFDFDGVFVDDFYFHKTHIEKFLNTSITNEEFYEIHSGNVFEDDNEGLELGNFDIKEYCKSIKSELVQLPIIEGMDNVAREAQKLGASFIVSSGCEANIRGFFNDKNICEDLCTIYGVEISPSKKIKFEKIIKETNVDAENVIFITDTLGDIREASSLGIASIAVTWGFQRIDTLEQGIPFGFAHTAKNVTQLIKEYFSI